MSGGSLSYLYNKQFPEVCNYIGEMKKVEKELISQGYTDIARDVRRLIEYCLTAERMPIGTPMIKAPKIPTKARNTEIGTFFANS